MLAGRSDGLRDMRERSAVARDALAKWRNPRRAGGGKGLQPYRLSRARTLSAQAQPSRQKARLKVREKENELLSPARSW